VIAHTTDTPAGAEDWAKVSAADAAALSCDVVCARLGVSERGLAAGEVARRLETGGPNAV